MDLSSDDEMNVLSGMYGIQDKQNFQKQNVSPSNPRSYDVSYTNIIEVVGDRATDKSKYEYKNKLVIKDGIPKLLFAKIDQTGLSLNKWNLTLGCQDEEYTEEEMKLAKSERYNPLINKLLPKVILEGNKVMIENELNKNKNNNADLYPKQKKE